MAAGDVNNPERVRIVSNERFDVVDADAMAAQALVQQDAASRALLASPLATAAAPVGQILSGGTVTVNPTGPTDGLLRVDSPLFTGLDSDGRMLIKPAGTAISVAIPAGGAQHQIYLYYLDIKVKTAKRRAIPVTAPFTEFTITPQTRFQGSVGVHVRAGGLGTVIAVDTVNGVTTPLLFLGIVVNAVGVVTYDGTATNNRIGAVKEPVVKPSSSTTSNGSARTLLDHSQSVAWEVARTKFSGVGGLSGVAADLITFFIPDRVRVQGLAGMTQRLVGQYITFSGAANPGNNGTFRIVGVISATTIEFFNPTGVVPDANTGAIVWSVFAHDLPGGTDPPQGSTNFGAWAEPRRGLDEVDRGAPGIITIGNGTSTFGTFDVTEFIGHHEVLLKTAITAAVAMGGAEIVLKPEVILDNFAADIDLDYYAISSATVDITIRCEGAPVGYSSGDNFIALGSHRIKTMLYGSLTLRGVNIRSSGTALEVRGRLEAHDCVFQNDSIDAGASIVTSGTGVSRLRFLNCLFRSSTNTADDTKVSFVNVVASSLLLGEVHFDGCTFDHHSLRRGVQIDLNSTGAARFIGCTFLFPVDHGSELSVDTSFIRIVGGSFDSTVIVNACRFKGSLTGSGRANYVGICLHDAGRAIVSASHFEHILRGVRFTSGVTQSGNAIIYGCIFTGIGAPNANQARGVDFSVAPVNSTVDACQFNSTGIRGGGSLAAGNDVYGFLVRNCSFSNSTFSITASTILLLFGGLHVEGCVFDTSLSTSVFDPPIVLLNTTNGVARGTFIGNVFSGFFSPAASDLWLGLRVIAFEIDLQISGNVFRGINSSGFAYVGAVTPVANGGPNRLIALEAHIHRWSITNNVGEALGVGGSGANLEQITCIDVHTKVRGSADAGSILEGCVISGNRFGDSTSNCSFLKVGSTTASLQIGSLKIHGNQHRTASSVAGTAIAAYGWSIMAETSVGTSCVLRSSNNEWRIDSPAGTLNVDWFILAAISTGMTFEVVTIEGEVITIVGGAFTASRGYFIGSFMTVRSLIFLANVAHVPAATTNPVMYTEFSNIGSYGLLYSADPGSGANWVGNLRIRRN